jgi:Leucine-rich repeat (LRR) protein/PKD repeat protein
MKNKITNQLKRIFLIVLFCALANIANAQIVNIPDPNFKAALVAETAINTNFDAEIQVSEASTYFSAIYVNNQGISDLTGIEAFTSATYLNCSNNQLTNLDVSANSALSVLLCDNNQLTTLNVSANNTALQLLWCYGNQLSSLDVSACPALQTLDCNSNQLISLNVASNTLEYLDCKFNQLSSLDVSASPALQTLYCNNNVLSSLDVSVNTDLGLLNCDNNQLISLDVSANTALVVLYCGSNQLVSLDVSASPALYSLYCNNNVLSSLDVSANTALSSLNCYNNQLISLDVSVNTDLGLLNCDNNQLISLDVSANTTLNELRCYNNQLISLDVSVNTNLGLLNCAQNGISSLDLSTNINLNSLDCNSNQLTTLNVQNGNNLNFGFFYAATNPSLTCIQVDDVAYMDANWSGYIDAGASFSSTCNCLVNIPDANFKNALLADANINTNLDGEIQCTEASAFTGQINVQNANISNLLGIEAFVNLSSLWCVQNQIADLNLSTNIYLQSLFCQDNQIINLNLNGLANLDALWCYNNQLTTLDLNTNTSLSTLHCDNNQITTLDLSANINLNDLDCSDNLLTNLNIQNGNNINLTFLQADNNPSLFCIEVDDPTFMDNNFLGYIDSWASFATNCSCLINIPDANFKNALLADLSINTNADGEIQCSEAIAYTGTINVSSLSINDLTGIEAFTSLTVLDCSNNQLTALDVSTNAALEILDCAVNQLNGLDVSNNTALTELFCNENLLTSLNTTSNTNLTILDVGDNQLSSINLNSNSQLTEFRGARNSFISIDFTSNPNLGLIFCDGNNLTSLNSSNLLNLSFLLCQDNFITSLDVSLNNNLVQLICDQNQLTSLNIQNGNNVNLSLFNATNNPSLTCIQVDNVSYMNTNWASAKDAGASYSTNCSCTNPTAPTGISGLTGICNGANTTLSANGGLDGSGAVYEWGTGAIGSNIIAGQNTSSITVSPSINTTYWVRRVGTVPPCTNNTAGVTQLVTVTANVVPSLSISANPGNTICNGTSVTFTATPVNGGAAPAYQWKLNGANVGSNSATYTNASLSNGNTIQCVLTSNANCASPLTANSNTINMTVNSSVTPSISISANPGATICNGTSVTFTATPVNGGAAPAYQWQVNGANVGTNSNTYTSTTLSNNNIVSCILTSNANCASPTQVGSNNINMLVNPNLTPSVTISATSTTVCSGSTIDFTANATNGGVTPAYQWQVNGINVGTNATTYSTASLLNNDVITCILTSNETCLTTANATSNSITLTNGNVTPTVTINASQTSGCAGTSITFSASTTDGGTIPIYQWQVNGIDVGSNLSTYTSTSLADNDVVQCILTSNALCITTNTVNSNSIQITIIAAVIPTVNITANPGTSICSAVPVTFTANPVNGGTPNYQWKLNGFNVGTNSNSYTTNTLNDNDIVTCEMTSNANCANPVLVTSNSLTISVTGNVTPSIIISSANGNTICEGTSVTLNANTQNEGVAPQFEWMINGITSGNNSNTFTTNALLNGDVVQCILTSSLACASPITASSNNIGFIVNPNLNSSLIINASQSTICAGTSVYFTTSVQNGGSQPAFQWQLNGINVGSNSPFYSASNFNNNDVVSCWLISNEACVVQNPSNSNDINITVNNNVFSPNFLADQTVLTQIPFTVNFTNTTPNQGSYVYQWYFGDGSTSTDASPTHQFNSSGTYTVALQAVDSLTGCVDEIIKNDYIICSNGTSNCNYNNTLNYTGIVNGCIGGYLDLSVSTTAVNPTYQWVRDGVYIGGATQSTFHANVSGSYSVIVYNNGGCAVPSSSTQVAFSGTAPVLPTVNQTGNLNPCVPSVVTLDANAPGANSFLWNTGSTNSTINVSQSGYYTVTAFFGIGCQASSLPLPLSGSLAPNPGICLVTVDSATNNNLIVWETPNSTNIDSILIYKETSNLNIFQKIGSVGYYDLSEFIDGSSNTQIQGYRYQIVVLDTCGGLTLPSYAHKTIHLQINPGVNNNRELSWSAYEGTNFVAYEIWRKIPGDVFQLLTTVPASQNIYTDNNPPSLDADYKIEIVLAQTCNSIDRASYGKSKSNVGNNQAILLVPDGIEDKNLLANVKLLPNPSDGNTLLQWESLKAQNLQIVVTDVVGKIVLADKVSAQKGSNTFSIEVDAAGVYFVTIFDANGSKNVLKMVVR